MTDGPFAVIARIARTHGLKGEVSVVPTAEASLSLLIGLEMWFVPPSRSVRSARLASVRPGPKGELASFEGVSSIQLATALVGKEVLARSDQLPADWLSALEEPDDVVGYSVVDGTHGHLGRIEETIITGANDVWVVHGPFGEVLVPVIEDVVDEIDDDERTIRVTLLPGLLPEDEEEA